MLTHKPRPPAKSLVRSSIRRGVSRFSLAKQKLQTNGLQRFLTKWDAGSPKVRIDLLQQFIANHGNASSMELEQEFENGASLLLSRISSSLRLAYNMIGTYPPKYLPLHFRAIGVFVTAQARAEEQFLHEVVSSGILLVALEMIFTDEPFVNTDESCFEALSLLRKLARQGRHYKEVMCEHRALEGVARCLRDTSCTKVQGESRSLLIELASGNPLYSTSIRDLLVVLLPNPEQSRSREVSAHVLLSLLQSNSAYFAEWSRDSTWVERLVPAILGLHCTVSPQLVNIVDKIVWTLGSDEGIAKSLVAGQAHLLGLRASEVLECMESRFQDSNCEVKHLAVSHAVHSMLQLIRSVRAIPHGISVVRVALSIGSLVPLAIILSFSCFEPEVRDAAMLLLELKVFYDENELCSYLPAEYAKRLHVAATIQDVRKILNLENPRCMPGELRHLSDTDCLGDRTSSRKIVLTQLEKTLCDLFKANHGQGRFDEEAHSVPEFDCSIEETNIDIDFIEEEFKPLPEVFRHSSVIKLFAMYNPFGRLSSTAPAS